MFGPPPELLKEIDEARDLPWMLCDVVRINKQQVVAVIAKVVDGVPWFHESPPFPTERSAREYVAQHNERIVKANRPLPQRPPTVININGNAFTTSPAAIPIPDDDEGWFDENRDYRKAPPVLDDEFEIQTGSDGATVKRWKKK
jgi:hypothetical protein